VSDGGAAKQQLLREASQEFQAAMPARLRELSVSLQQWRDDGDENSGRSLLQMLHSIHGAAALFGMVEMGDVAGRGERLVRQIIEGRLPVTAQAWSELHDAVSRMRLLL
jgi:chemotaxis protein histidine kinase CheA